ncbi:hypothetical protein ACWFRN_14110, partial [Streptomyces celluloflavus]
MANLRRPPRARPHPPAQWEPEALDPAELQCLVLAAVDPYIDCDVLARQTAREEEQRRAPRGVDIAERAGGGGARPQCPPTRPSSSWTNRSAPSIRW